MFWTKEIPKIDRSDFIVGSLLSFFVIIGTFPPNNWSYSIGIDPPLFWVFNHLFENGLNGGRHIIFPHGPLAFFMYPLTENILIAIVVSSGLKALLVFSTLFLLYDLNKYQKWFVVLIFTFIVSGLSNFNHLLLANLLILYCNYYQKPHFIFKLAALLLTAFAFYVKAYVAIVSGTFLFSFLVYQVFIEKQVKRSLIDGIVFCAFALGFWLFMYGTPKGVVQYVWGMMHLAQDNSSAAAYYPENNWFFLALSLSGMISLFVLNCNKKTTFFTILVGLSLFASWKHGMAREDFFHIKGLLIYLIICLSVFLLFIRKNTILNGILFILTIGFFAANIPNSFNYQKPELKTPTAKHFFEFITSFDDLKQASDASSYNNSKTNVLPQHMRDSIAQSSVDIYPWDYSIAAVNKLNWHPRVVIQSYAAYTSWLDKQNSNHFSSSSAPEYLVWERQKVTQDFNNNSLNSLDNRYLLNDEPQTILQLISRYRLVSSDDKFDLYKLRKHPISFRPKHILTEESGWGDWINVHLCIKSSLPFVSKSC